MHTTPTRVLSILSLFSLAITCLVLSPTSIWAQDSPGRFELGGTFSANHLGLRTEIGPGVEGDVNFGRHFALDASYSWLPSLSVHFMTGLFGAKVGTRTKHFGFFGKVRPGFISLSPIQREAIETFDPQTGSVTITSRFARVNERALDFGGVVEYYPARHWAIRWDCGDLVQFTEPGPTITEITLGAPQPTLVIHEPGGTFNNFRFDTGIHYRF
jgi:hypothetical protein